MNNVVSCIPSQFCPKETGAATATTGGKPASELWIFAFKYIYYIDI
mgnify:CR=1 FL=1